MPNPNPNLRCRRVAEECEAAERGGGGEVGTHAEEPALVRVRVRVRARARVRVRVRVGLRATHNARSHLAFKPVQLWSPCTCT